MRIWKSVGWLVAAIAVGLGIGLLRGTSWGVRADVGDLSAPWLLIALIPGWFAGSWWRGAMLGLATTLVGLLGFYAGTACCSATTSGSAPTTSGRGPSW